MDNKEHSDSDSNLTSLQMIFTLNSISRMDTRTKRDMNANFAYFACQP